jgi:conjugative relaxase-like TrwC/TraI family protein
MRMMGADSVAYHPQTVLGRGDDHPGQALDYYASRGETPLVWGGSGSSSLNLSGAVAGEGYEAVFGPGGARDPLTGRQLVWAKRPGMELVISAHKSVAELGVIGRAEDMHRIMDTERDATLAYLDRVTRTRGGRRGRTATATETSGLTYAHTRHATSRAGDPCPHDHVLLANLVEMLDARGGWKAADTVAWREHVPAATMIGRHAAARTAVELGYRVEPDDGPSGRLRHWRIAGVPDAVIDLHSKRSAEIDAETGGRGEGSYGARSVAARTTRSVKRHEAEVDLIGRWRAELADAGWPVERLAKSIDAAEGRPPMEPSLRSVRKVLAEVLAGDGELARRKVFARRHLIVELAPYFYGHEPKVLDAVVARALADPEVVPLGGVAGARDQVFSLASVLACETAIAESLGRQVARSDGPAVDRATVEAAMTSADEQIGGRLADGQRQAAEAICTSGRGAELVVGIAGSGKTTILSVVTAAFERTGYLVVGTATSGQAARTLGREASIGESRTLTSLAWRLDHGQLELSARSVVILDEVGMTDDAALIRLAGYIETARAKLVLVGDDRQLGPVGPGGALGALIARHPDAVHYLGENRRQADPEEGQALQHLRAGNVSRSLSWYARHGRIHPVADRQEALDAAVGAWAADVMAGRETGLYAWRRSNVAALNTRARAWMDETGRLSGAELDCGSGNRFRAGDQVVALAPNHTAGLVTSQRAVVESVDPQARTLTLRSGDGQFVCLPAVEASADRVAYGYATTVHRAQGATVDRAHLFSDGGGRELAYVAMSRARTGTHAWVVADDLGQAIDELQGDWSNQKLPRWAIDTGLPDPSSARRDDLRGLPDDQKARVVALVAAGYRHTANQLAGLHAPDLQAAITSGSDMLERTIQARADLVAGVGVYHDSEAGRAVRDLVQARARRQQARDVAEHSDRRRDRHTGAREADHWAYRVADAEVRWHAYVTPEAARLDNQITRHQQSIERLNERRHDLAQAGQRVHAHGTKAGEAARQLGAQLDHRYRANLDGITPDAATRAARQRAYPRADKPGPEPTRRLVPDL